MRLVMSGGGTGGHLFPALALAGEFKRSFPGIEIVFIGAKGGIEERVVPACGYPMEFLEVSPLKGRSAGEKVKSVCKAAGATLKARSILKRVAPQGVIGCGSYTSGPVVLAAKTLGMKTAILEQNLLPGMTNKYLARIVNRAYVAFEESGKFFSCKTLTVGTPVREEILECAGGRGKEAREKFTLFVFGGSQGATPINAAFFDATEFLRDIWPDIEVIHQTGEEGYKMAQDAYHRKGLGAELHRFVDDMAGAYKKTDLVVCRAGATTIAEITAIGLPSILVPYPFASDDHQRANAQYLEGKGASVMLLQDDLTGALLAKTIRSFYEDRERLEEVRKRALKLGRPDAAKTIAQDFLKLIKGGNS